MADAVVIEAPRAIPWVFDVGPIDFGMPVEIRTNPFQILAPVQVRVDRDEVAAIADELVVEGEVPVVRAHEIDGEPCEQQSYDQCQPSTALHAPGKTAHPDEEKDLRRQDVSRSE